MWGEPCLEHGCEFYDKIPASGEYACRHEITNLMLNDLAAYLELLLKSAEGHRTTVVERDRSGALGEATPEYLKILNLSPPRVDLPVRK